MLVFIWRGLGWLVAVIVFALSLIANLIVNSIYGDRYYDNHKWPFAISLLASGVVCWIVGLILKKRTDRSAIDPLTGQEFVINQSRHTLFFIPMQFWGPLLIAGAVVILAMEMLHRNATA